MKINTKSAAIIAALAMATTGALALNQTEADASTVATVHAGTTARLYTPTGKLVQNRALAPSTPWLVGKIANINGETMYQVSTNEYLRAADSSLSGDQANQENKLIGKADYTLTLYNTKTGHMANRSLAKGSSWQIGKYYMNKAGQRFVQVSTYEYADAANMSFNRALPDPISQDDFGAGNTFRGTVFDPNNSTTGSTTTTPDTNTNTDNSGSTTTEPSNNNSGSTTTTPSTGTDTGSNETSTPNLTEVNAAVLSSINNERASKGLSPVVSDSTLNQAAATRVKEMATNFGHVRPDGSQWYTILDQLGANYSIGGENGFLTLYNQLATVSATHLAEVEMNNWRGETFANNHYDNVMNPKFTKVGIASYYEPSTDTIHITQDYTN